MLQNLNLKIEQLLLDPNNPRFIKDLRDHEHVGDENVKDLQDETLNKFSNQDTSDEEDVTNIRDLYDSMITIGYVAIDRIVVKKLASSEDYLVIEGNRRISTIKKILDDLGQRKKPFDRQQIREKIEPLLETFNTITCMFLDTSGMSEQEVAHKISVILGLRHHGSLLPWEPLPRAYNCYKEYMELQPKLDGFVLDNQKIKHVSSQLSVSQAEVKKALRTYMVFSQLSDLYDIKDSFYSLIAAGVTNKSLDDSYFKIDPSTFQMDDASLDRMNKICQFAKRDNINPTAEKKILTDPKAFTKLGKLIEKRRNSPHDAIKRYADDLVHRVEDEQDLDMILDQALDDLTNMELSVKWIETINAMLVKQESDLPISEYSGIGNDRANKDEVKKRVEPLKLILRL